MTDVSISASSSIVYHYHAMTFPLSAIILIQVSTHDHNAYCNQWEAN